MIQVNLVSILEIASIGREQDERQDEYESGLVDTHLHHGLEKADGFFEHVFAPYEPEHVELYARRVVALYVAVLANHVDELVRDLIVERRRRHDEDLHGAAL